MWGFVVWGFVLDSMNDVSTFYLDGGVLSYPCKKVREFCPGGGGCPRGFCPEGVLSYILFAIYLTTCSQL